MNMDAIPHKRIANRYILKLFLMALFVHVTQMFSEWHLSIRLKNRTIIDFIR